MDERLQFVRDAQRDRFTTSELDTFERRQQADVKPAKGAK